MTSKDQSSDEFHATYFPSGCPRTAATGTGYTCICKCENPSKAKTILLHFATAKEVGQSSVKNQKPRLIHGLIHYSGWHYMLQFHINKDSLESLYNMSWKIESGELAELIQEHDIFCLHETWLQGNALVSINGYHCFRSDRKAKSNSKRASGGVLTYFKNKLQRGLTRLPSENPDCLWTKIDKAHFNLPNDVFLCNTYIVPRDSPYFHRNDTDVLGILHNEINHL